VASTRRGGPRTGLAAVALASLALVATGCASTAAGPPDGAATPAAGASAHQHRSHPARPATTTTTTTTLPSVPATQSSTLPSATTPQFHAEMAALFRAVQDDAPALGERSFFPESAYVRLKAIADPSADYEDRLLADYRLDVGAAHALLGPAAAGARLVGVQVPTSEAAWIPPGYCYNSIGYWHDPGARLLYEEAGQLHSFGIASLISWHGVWYVVHLGAVLRSTAAGVVDSPAIGPGTPGPPGGC